MLKVFLLFISLSVVIMAFEESKGTVGYGRLQTSLQDDKENTCFKLPGAGTKYRLGNECESWIELGVYQDIKFDNGIKVHNQVRASFLGENEKSIDFLRWDEFYSEAFNLLDNNNMSVWIGRRFYKRYDSYISDHFFFNMSGTGFGISDFDLTNTISVSYSYIFDDLQHDTFVANEKLRFNSHDIRFKRSYEGGYFTLFLNYMNFGDETFVSGKEVKSSDGYAVGLLHKGTNISINMFDLKGDNITGIFYGSGAAKSAGSASAFLQDGIIDTMFTNNSKIDDAKTLRLINYNAFENDTFGIMSNIVYEQRDEESFSGIKQDWFSAGVRPFWFLDKNIRLVSEVGYDRVDDKAAKQTYNLSKVSAAVEFALDKGVWEHPVLRFFYTYAEWSDNAKGMVADNYYVNKTAGDNVGIQLEYWW